MGAVAPSFEYEYEYRFAKYECETDIPHLLKCRSWVGRSAAGHLRAQR